MRGTHRLQGFCWLLASIGIRILQLHLMVQIWDMYPYASITAILAVEWLLGAFARHLWHTWNAGVFLLVASVLVFFGVGDLPPLLTLLFASLFSFVLGSASDGWLVQIRPWSPSRPLRFGAETWAGTAALAIVCLLPASNALIGVALLAPLLLLDTKFRQEWSFFAVSDRVSLLTQHRTAVHTRVLSGFVTSSQSALWYAVMVAFAKGLEASHTLPLLLWLVTGQIAIWLLWWGWDRLRPSEGGQRTGMVALLLSAVGLFLLTVFHLPLSLAASIAVYTLGMLLWKRYMMPLAMREGEAYPVQKWETIEQVLVMCFTLPLGIGIDIFGVATTLLSTSSFLLLLLLLAAWDLLITHLSSTSQAQPLYPNRPISH